MTWYTLAGVRAEKYQYHKAKRGDNMANIEGLTNEEIKEIIVEQLKDVGMDVDSLEIDVKPGPEVVLSGKVESEGARYLAKKTIMDIVGIDELNDELVVIDEPESLEEEDEDGGLYNRDEDDELTEDPFKALEDGIPYIPPDRPSHDESSEDVTWKKRNKKKN
jgi:hypothetical protein